MKKVLIGLLILLLILLCCGICFGVAYFTSQIGTYLNSEAQDYTLEYVSGDVASSNKIQLIKINGIILDTEDDIPSIFSSGYVFGYQIKEMLYSAVQDESIKGIILDINSGGGTVLGSRAIVDGINYYKNETGNPVYAYIRGFGASGAYMVASAAEYITADYGSLTGSIGVIFGTPFQYYDKVISQGNTTDYVVTQNGIETFYVSAGEYKDIGNPYRKMTSEELDSLQINIDNEYEAFVSLVSSNRSISSSKIKDDIKALIYGNTQALELGLIDKEATYDDSLKALVDKIGLDSYQVVTNKTDDLLSMFLYSLSDKIEYTANPLQNRMLLIYGDPSLYQ